MTKIKPPYSDGRVELNGGADRIRDAQISWTTLFSGRSDGSGQVYRPRTVFHRFCMIFDRFWSLFHRYRKSPHM